MSHDCFHVLRMEESVRCVHLVVISLPKAWLQA